MRWWRELLGLQSAGAKTHDPPRAVPPIFPTIDPDSVFVGYNDGEQDVLTTRDTYEFAFGLATGGPPRQRDLDEHFARTDRVVVRSTGMARGRAMSHEVLVDTTDRERVHALAGALRIREETGPGSHCACVGGPTIMLYAGAEVVATIGVQHGSAIRWKRWRPDAPLADGSLLVAWLQSSEIEPALLDMLLHNQYDNGLSPMGYQLPGGRPLSLSEQRLRVIEVRRVRGEDTRVALAAVSEVLSSDPTVPLGHALSALMHLELREYELVLQDCTRARGVGMVDTRLLYASAVACHALGRLKDGVDACEEALVLEPANPSILNSRGALRADLGLAQEALADFEEAHRLAPQWFRPVLNRARVRIGLGAQGAAREDLRMVLSMLARPTGPEEVAARDLALRMTGQLGPS